MFPEHGQTATALLANAAVAVNHAKATNRSGYRFFIKELREAALARITLAAELRRAIDRRDLRSGQVNTRLRPEIGRCSRRRAR
jgi:hypothetical protein